MINWSQYLESLCNAYAQWWQIYTITDVVGQKRVESEPSPLLFDFGLMVQTVEREREERGKGEEKVERLSVLEGLRKYASEHVLLVGRPGSGKSTALARLLLEEAGKARTPVLVELRYYRTSILDLIQEFLQRHDPNLTVDAETLKSWLRQGQLLLLLDGLNELPSEEARRDLQKFRQDYQKTTPMIFTTRDLGVGGDLNIAKKLEMQPLSEAQMQQFVRAYLSQQGEEMLRQLGSRLREFGQTPLLLWMLCSLFRAMGKVPANLGLVFRQFALSYDRKLKQDIPNSGESRRWWHRLLEHLAWVMTSGDAKTQLQVAIPRQKAEAVLTEFLAGKVAYPEDCALRCLEDLLNHHLIQLGAGDQIEFRHQLIQEYYTAESLLKLLTSPPAPLLQGEGSNVHVPPFPRREGGLGGLGLTDDELKREYLNYLKWTEPLVLMLELVEDETQAVRVVKLALEVDWWLGARLAGAVQPKWQEQTVGLVTGLEIHLLLKVQFLGITKAESAVPILIKALQDENPSIRERAAYSLGNIGTEASIASLSKALLEDEDSSVREVAVHSLGNIGSNTTIQCLIQAINDEDYSVHLSAANALIKIGSKLAISSLIKCLGSIEDDRRYNAPASAVAILGRIGSKAVIPCLIKYFKNNYIRGYTRGKVAYILGEIGLKEAIDALEQALEDKDYYVREVATDALKKIEFKTKNIELNNDTNKLLEDKKYSMKEKVSEALEKIDYEKAISSLIKALNDKEYYVRIRAVEALGEIGSEEAISILIKALDDKQSSVRSKVAEVLGKIGSEEAIPNLIKALDDEASYIRSEAVEALGKIGSEEAIPSLIHSLEDKEHSVPGKVADALSKIGSEAAIPLLTKALEDEDFVAANQGNTLNQATKALQAIQNRYKLYNPTLIQPISTSEPQPNIPPLQPISTQFLHNHRQDFPLNPDQIILVPGNHDLNWFLAKKAYKLIDRDDYDGELIDGYYKDSWNS